MVTLNHIKSTRKNTAKNDIKQRDPGKHCTAEHRQLARAQANGDVGCRAQGGEARGREGKGTGEEGVEVFGRNGCSTLYATLGGHFFPKPKGGDMWSSI